MSLIFVFWLTAGFVASVIFSSFFEWALHRFLMPNSYHLRQAKEIHTFRLTNT